MPGAAPSVVRCFLLDEGCCSMIQSVKLGVLFVKEEGAEVLVVCVLCSGMCDSKNVLW